MSEDISRIVLEWGYSEEVAQKFKDEGIRVKHLLTMSEYTLEKFFPKAGERLDFQEKVDNYRKNMQQVKPLELDMGKTASIFVDCDVIDLDNLDGSLPAESVLIDPPQPGIANLVSTQPIQPESTATPAKRARLIDEVESLLTSSVEGKMVLSFFKTERNLNDFHRQKLADEIIRFELKEDIEKSFPHNRVEFWSKKIVGFFSEENYAVWAGDTPGKSRERAAGRGMLLTRYYNMRRKLIKSGVIRKSSVLNSDLNPAEDSSAASDQELTTEMANAIQWLRNNGRSVAQVYDKWGYTSLSRVQYLRQNRKEVHEYMSEFPALKNSDGYTLLEMDFEKHYPNEALKIYTEWPVLSNFILSKVLVKEKESVEDSFTSDGKKAKTLRCLHSLFPVKTVFGKKKKQWRPSRVEARDGLIQYVKTSADILPTLNERRQKYEALGIHLGPQAVLVSVDEDTITESHVCINHVVYEVSDPFKAFDVAFKAMHMLDCCYPVECSREMLFLQQAIYGITSEHDKKIKDTKTTSLVQEYQRYKSK